MTQKNRDTNMQSNDLTETNREVLRVSDSTSGQGSDLISIADVAVLLSISKQAAARIAAGDKTFPRAFKLNARTLKYSRVEVLAWLQSKQDK